LSLSQSQADALETIAIDCSNELREQDAKAMAIINAVRARYSSGELAQHERVPAPPPELSAFQKRREEIVLKARQRLLDTFGAIEFSRVDQLIQANIASGVRVVDGTTLNTLRRPK
jgi:hypothetical protein